MSIRIRTPSRLHFGLLSAGSERSREFGGVGLMIEGPGISLAIRFSDRDLVTGTAPAETMARASRLVSLIRERLGLESSRAFAVEILDVAPEHHGLGTGTQLSIALASAICRLVGESRSREELADMTGRGNRSALGVHGFHAGGFLVDGGKGPRTKLAPAIVRMDFPKHWPILLVRPELPSGLFGTAEQTAFSNGFSIPRPLTDRLARLVLLDILPSLAENDFLSFGESLFSFNRAVGEIFAPAQGGTYAAYLLADIVRSVRDKGLPAVGQSSWGPTLFVILPDSDQATWLQSQLAQEFSLPPHSFFLTRADNVGAQWQRESSTHA